MKMKMKKLILCAIAVVTLFVAGVRAQDITGSWQGTLEAGRPLRVVVKISTDAGALKAVFYSIDQGGQGIAAGAVSLQGTTVKFAVPGIGANYEGKLGADASSITGTFTQGPGSLALNLVRAAGDA